MTTFIIPDKSAVTTVDADADVLPIWQGVGQHKATARQIVDAVPMVGDTGSGGVAGIVPAPASGDAAASKFLAAGGSWAPAPQLIDSNVSYSVGSGGDFATLPAALTHLTSRKITSTLSSAAIRVVLNILPGTLVHTDYIYYINMELKNVTLAGVAYSSNVTSVQSSSGSAGAWSIILNMSDVSNAAVNDYINIMTVTGGVNPTWLAGCHKITNVDVGNSRITITSTHAAATAPSGATASTSKIMKSILQFNGCHGLLMWDGHSTLNAVDLVIAGNRTVATQGLSFQDLARGNLNDVAVVNFGDNIWVQQSSNVYCGSVTLSSAVNDNLHNKGNAVVDATAIVLSGAGRYGAYNDTGAMFGGSTALATGNVTDGFHMDSGAGLQFDTPSATGNTGWGYSSKNFSPSVVANFAGSGNTLGLSNSQVAMSDGGDITLPTSLQSTMGYGTGVIYKGTNYFLHNFNYGNNGTVTTVGKNLFLGELAGNLSSGVAATNTYEASDNTGIGYQCLYNVTIGYDNTAVGYGACQAVTSGADNTAVGSTALNHINTAAWNTAVGVQSLTNLTTGGNNTAIGGRAGKFISGGSVANTTGANSVLIGYLASPLADGDTNETVIGYATTGNGSNTVTVGNSSITGTWLSGSVTAPSYISTATITGGLTKGAYSYGTIPYSAVDLFASYNLSVNGYTQLIVSNSSNGATASSNIVVSNNLSTDSSYYGAFGINSSGFTGTGALNLPNATYLSCKTGDLVIGTEGATTVRLLANSAVTDAITIPSTNIPTLNDANTVSATALNGQMLQHKTLTELTTIAASATTATTIQLPAAAIILAVSCYVQTAIPTATTFTVGDAGSAARYNTAAVSVNLGSSDKGTKAGAYFNSSATNVIITPNGTPAANTGRVRVTIHYIEVTAATS